MPTTPTATTDVLVGTFSGDLWAPGWDEPAERAYVTFTKLSSDAVKMKIVCTNYGLDMKEIILRVTASGDGTLVLKPENTGYVISGTYTSGKLNLSFMVSDIQFQFLGTK